MDHAKMKNVIMNQCRRSKKEKKNGDSKERMGRLVTYTRCGTPESWERHKEEYPNSYHVIPASVYVSETGICLVTSEEWVDWLTGRTDKIPVTE